jgi:rubrerythrin
MENESFGGIKVMADISYENLLVNKIQATKIKGRMSLKQYCLTDTGDEAENERRKRLLEEYSEKNKERINRISSGSNKKVWWKCREAGHEWETMVSTRSKLKSNCPFCCGQRVTKENSVLSYIEKNGTYGEKLRKEYSSENELGLDEISYGSGKRVWWKCSTCGYEWEAIVKNRVQYKYGCPKCAGKIASERNSLLSYIEKNGAYGEKLRKEYSEKNEKLLDEICYGSLEQVIWKCSVCKREWTTILKSRTGVIKSGCPFCNKNGTSFPEQLIFYILKRELDTHEVFNRDKSEGKEIDVYIPSLKFGIEYDGWFYHQERQGKDNKKHQYFKERGLDIIRIIGKADDEPVGVECDLEYNTNKDTELIEVRKYIKDYLYEHYNIKIDISMTEDEIEECKKEARKQIENTLGGFSLDELNIPEDEEIEEEFEFLPAYL